MALIILPVRLLMDAKAQHDWMLQLQFLQYPYRLQPVQARVLPVPKLRLTGLHRSLLIPTGWMYPSVNTFSSFISGYQDLNVGNVTSHVVTGLTAGVTYYYRIRAVDYCGASLNSATITYATLPAAPAVPGPVTGTATQCAGLTGQVYSIGSVPGATTYTLVSSGRMGYYNRTGNYINNSEYRYPGPKRKYKCNSR